MAMDRLRRVSNMWNWLPAFRVVAEYESIQKAAVILSVSASALSRTVRLLEDATGGALFVRSATGLALTTFGAELLKGTREAMRRIDDVIAGEEAAAGADDRVFTAAASGPLLARVLDQALCSVVRAREVEGVRYRATSIEEEAVVAELLRGNIDLALVEGGAGLDLPDDLTSERIGELAFAVLAPPTHPMSTQTAISAADLEAAKVVTLSSTTPNERSARAVASVASMESAERFATEGPFLALLPPALAPPTFRVVAPSPARARVVVVSRKPLEKEPSPMVLALTAAIRSVAFRTP